MTYSIGEVSKMLNISISTLRYYDKEGLLPYINRTKGNTRLFSDADLESLQMIECLKNTGLQIKEIKQFFEWCEEGDASIDKRYELFMQQREKTEKQIAVLYDSLKLINYKCDYYAAAKEGRTIPPFKKDESQEVKR